MGSLSYVVSKKRRRRNLLTTTFLPVDGKADGRITCREQEEEEKEEEDEEDRDEEDRDEKERCIENYEMSRELTNNGEDKRERRFKEDNFSVEQRYMNE